MKLTEIFLVAVISAATAFGVTRYDPASGRDVVQKETVFERVMRTNTLRCGYYVFPPVVMRDPNTNQMSGFSIDMMEAVAAKTGIKIE